MSNALDSLSSRLRGEVLRDEIALKRYSTDESMFSLKPLAISLPKDADDVRSLLVWAHETKIPLTARGAGTSTAGQAIGSGAIVDFTKFMNALLEVDAAKRLARVQPGLIYDDLNGHLKQHRLFFPVNPSSGQRCTLGGMIANNASGPYSLKYGATKDNVEGLTVILANGRTLETENPPGDLCAQVAGLLEPHRRLIERCTPKTRVNSSGYHLLSALNCSDSDLTPIFLASEGTLGLIVEARLRLTPLPKRTATAVLGFRNLEDCGKAVLLLNELKPQALEIVDDELLAVMRQHSEMARVLLAADLQAAIFLQFDSNDCDVDASMHTAKARVETLTAGFTTADDEAALWALRREASPLLHDAKSNKQPLRFIEDGAVPPERLPEFWRGLKAILREHAITGATFGHAGNGHLHINPRLDPLNPTDQIKIRQIYTEQTKLVLDLGGTISGEHGDGLLRTAAVRAQFQEVLPVFEAVKQFFDPHGILNPGKILDADPERPFRDWRYTHVEC